MASGLTTKKVEGEHPQRLVFYSPHVGKSYWDQFWSRYQTEDFLDSSLIEYGLHEYLPLKGKILEPGCGLGQNLAKLKALGYEVEGLDLSKPAVVKARSFDNGISLIVGDVLSLPYRNSSFRCCISMGVVEHFEEGPEEVIKEMHRVLTKNGMVLISVPFFNPLRRIKNRLGLYAKSSKRSDKFYQYAFTVREFADILRKCGFIPLKAVKCSAIHGFKEEISIMGAIGGYLQKRSMNDKDKRVTRKKNRRGILQQLLLRVLNSKFSCSLGAHIILLIAKKGAMYKSCSS